MVVVTSDKANIVQLQLVKLERERARGRNISFPVTKRRNEKLHKEGNEKSLKKDPKKRKSVRSFFLENYYFSALERGIFYCTTCLNLWRLEDFSKD
jgi:hypothetical protein